MITIAVGRASDSEVIRNLTSLFDRCLAEDLCDVALQLPRRLSVELDRVLQGFLAGPLRLWAWFPSGVAARYVEMFVDAGQRVTLGLSGLNRLPSVLSSAVWTGAAPWQIGVFLPMTQPKASLPAGFAPQSGTSLILGVGWTDMGSGPVAAPRPQQRDWAQAIIDVICWCTRHKVTVQLACGLPLCLFSTEQLGQIALLKVRTPLATCAPDLVITQNAEVRACPMLPGQSLNSIAEPMNLRALKRDLMTGYGCFAGFCGCEGEIGCRSLSSGACGGGCLAINAAKWRRGATAGASGSVVLAS